MQGCDKEGFCGTVQRLCRFSLCCLFLLEIAVLISQEQFILVRYIENANCFVIDINFLFSFATALVGRVDFNSVNQSVYHFRCQFFGVSIFANILYIKTS